MSAPEIPFHIGKIGHVALYVSDVERAKRFYTDVLGFQVSDIYGDDMMPGGAVFLRCNADHHGIALFKATEANPAGGGMHHMAFEVPTLDDVVRARVHLRAHNVSIDFDGRRRAGVQIAVEFRDPDNHRLEIYWGIDQIAPGEQARPAHEWKGAQSLEAAIADPVRGQDTRLRNPTLLQH
ncbi:MAG: VOC family protein [Rhodopila sp.]|jgi:catechol 2,3-dioxygenase-like lactoylglutathione lyase family enzyme